MHKIAITLDGDDLLELQAVLIDEDASAALEFLQTRIAPRLPNKGTAPCDSTRLNPYLLPPEYKHRPGAGDAE